MRQGGGEEGIGMIGWDGRDHKCLSDLVIATWTWHGNNVRSQWPDNPLSVRVPRATSITRCRQLRRALAFDMRERHGQPHIVLQITWWTTSAAATAAASAGGTGKWQRRKDVQHDTAATEGDDSALPLSLPPSVPPRPWTMNERTNERMEDRLTPPFALSTIT